MFDCSLFAAVSCPRAGQFVSDVIGLVTRPKIASTPEVSRATMPPRLVARIPEVTSSNAVTAVRQESAAGRLFSRLNFWEKTLKANNFVLSSVKFGYTIPFVSLPSTCFFKE